MPGIFGVFYYRSANAKTLETLKQFLPVPADALMQEFAEGATPGRDLRAHDSPPARGRRQAHVRVEPADRQGAADACSACYSWPNETNSSTFLRRPGLALGVAVGLVRQRVGIADVPDRDDRRKVVAPRAPPAPSAPARDRSLPSASVPIPATSPAATSSPPPGRRRTRPACSACRSARTWSARQSRTSTGAAAAHD